MIELKGTSDRVTVIIATGFGLGFIPIGPGTWGSLLGLLTAYLLIDFLKTDTILLQNILILAGALTAAVGIWSGGRAEKIFNEKDPGKVVIDEVCGQIISFVFIAPYLALLGEKWRWWMIAGFILFRVFDIFKPYPIDRLQDLRGGFGVMMDDVLAGIYAAIALSLILMLVI